MLFYVLFIFFSFKVHADIKPDNIILVNNVLKVTDLGLAFRVASPVQAVRRQTIRGTLGNHIYLSHFQHYKLLDKIFSNF